MSRPRPRMRTRHVASVAVVCVLVAAPSGADMSVLRRCGAKKLAAVATACEQTMSAWSRFARTADAGRRDRVLARALRRLGQRWARAERRDDGACAERTAPADDAGERLQRAAMELADGVLGTMPSPPSGGGAQRCTAKLLRLAGNACRSALRVERAYVRDADGESRRRGLARVADRFAVRCARRAVAPCPDTLDAAGALAALETLRADTAGDATIATLRALSALGGRPLGSAAEVEHLDPDPDYQPTLVREFASLTPQSALKWGIVHPEPDGWDFGPADRMLALAEANDMRARGHTLVWGSATDPPNPAWVEAVTEPAALRSIVHDHVTTLVTRYAGRIPVWDAVNEPLQFVLTGGDTDGLNDNHFLQVLGPSYIADTLAFAHAADPSARLFINEIFALEPGPKQDRLARLVEDLQAAGAPLDGVGFQGHVNFLPGLNRPTREQIEATFRRFAALGLDIEVTELTVHLWGLEGDQAARLDTQRRFYRDVVAACLAVDACRATTLWLFTDRYPTTIEQTLHQDAMPLVFDDDYHRKPAYFGVRAGLLTAP